MHRSLSGPDARSKRTMMRPRPRRRQSELWPALCGWPAGLRPPSTPTPTPTTNTPAPAPAPAQGPFFLGSSLSLVDITFIPMVERMVASLAYYKGAYLRGAGKWPAVDRC